MKTRQKIRKGLIVSSFFLFPAIFYYFSPVLIVQASSEGVINGSFIMFLFMFISSLTLGRAYCGWLCPGAGCQEVIFMSRDKKVTKGNYVKWLIWIPWIATIVLVALRSGGYHIIDFLYETTYGLSIGSINALISYFIVLIFFIILPAFIFGRRSFCHHLCWMAPFMILGRKFSNYIQCSSLRLESDHGVCKHCHTCTENCPMSLPVEDMVNQNCMENMECILCGTCVDGCKQEAIIFKYKKI